MQRRKCAIYEELSVRAKTGFEQLDELVRLAQSFDSAVAEKQETLTGSLLAQIFAKTNEVQEQGVLGREDFFSRQAFMLHVHNIEAMKLHREIPPNWGALVARQQVIAGFVDEMHKKAIAFGPIDSPQRSPLI